MSYSVVDGTGRFKDLATIEGIKELEQIADEALSEFLETGEADDTLAEEIRMEVANDERLSYLKPIFDGPAPFKLTNGITEDE